MKAEDEHPPGGEGEEGSMELPRSIRVALLEELDEYIDAVDEPDIETVVSYVLDQLQLAEDEFDLDDIAGQIEESAGLEGSLQDMLEEELESRDDFVFTGEEIVSAFEQLGGIEWVDEDVLDDDVEDEDEDEDDDEY
jgi:hypothetical protein